MSRVSSRYWTAICWTAAGAFDVYLIVRLFWLINAYSVNLIYWDNFNYYFLLARRWNFWQRFTAQLGPHREGFGMLLSSLIAPLTRWNMRAEAFAVGVVLVLAAHVCLWMKHRAFGRLAWYDLLVIPAFFLSPIQWEIWANTVNSSHGVLPLLFVMLYCLCWTIPRPGVRVASILVINFFSVFTGFGFFLGIITIGVFALMRKGIALLVSIASLAIFFVHYRFDPANPHFRLFDPLLVHLPLAVALGLSHAANFIYQPWNVLLGYCLLAGLLVAAVSRSRGLARGEAQSIIVVSCIAFTLMFMLFAAEGRLSLGPWCLTASRYLPLFVPGFAAAYLCVGKLPERPLKAALILVAVDVALSMSLRVNPDDLSVMDEYRTSKIGWIMTYQASGNLDKADRAVSRPIYPAPRPADIQTKIDYLQENRLNFFSP